MTLTSSQEAAKSLIAGGDRWQQAGAYAQSNAAYRQALALEPAEVFAFNNRALLHRLLGDPSSSAVLLRRALAIAPVFLPALLNLGEILIAAGSKAVTPLRRLVAVVPGSTEGLKVLGDAAAVSRDRSAPRWYRASLAVDPSDASTWRNLAVVAGDGQQAAMAYLRALRPAGVPSEWGKEASAAFVGSPASRIRQLATLSPALGSAWTMLADDLKGRHHFEEAARLHTRALAIDAQDGAALANLAIVRTCQGRLENARSLLRQAGAIDPGRAEIRYNLAHVLLALGEASAGWALHEHRWRIAAYPKPAIVPGTPMWNGRRTETSTLLIDAEQGLGDCIQFLRSIPAAAKRVGHVLLKLPEPLCALARMAGLPATILSTADRTPAHDLHAGIMSLPHLLGETAPDGAPYLGAPPERAAAWRARIGTQSYRIGVAWKGSPTHPYDALRSMDATLLRPLSDISGVRLLSLQHASPTPPWIEPLAADFGKDADGFVDMAAAMTALDLVISVDTSVVHLAGALGRPTWTLLATTTDWRWGRSIDTTPWYRSMRLFRQGTPGDWQSVVDDVADALRRRPG